MQTVNIHQAKTQLSKLIESVLNGEAFIIAKAGKPAAMLIPIPLPKQTRKFGAMKGEMQIADDFDAPLPDDIQSGFEGR